MNIKLEKHWTVNHNGEIYGRGYTLWRAVRNSFYWWRHKAWMKRMENIWLINDDCPTPRTWRHCQAFRKARISIIPKGKLVGLLR